MNHGTDASPASVWGSHCFSSSVISVLQAVNL